MNAQFPAYIILLAATFLFLDGFYYLALGNDWLFHISSLKLTLFAF